MAKLGNFHMSWRYARVNYEFEFTKITDFSQNDCSDLLLEKNWGREFGK